MNRGSVRTVLAATDLTRTSDAVLASAGRVATAWDAALHVVHALDMPWEPAEESSRQRGFQKFLTTARGQLAKQVDRALPDTDIASTTVVTYTAYRAILDRSHEVMADLVVVGPHRGGGPATHFLGTTADRVIRTSAAPVLVVDDILADPISRIGVLIDFSDPARGALEVGLRWAAAAAESAQSTVGVRVLYIGWPVEAFDDPDMEETRIRPELDRQIELARNEVEVDIDRTIDISVDVVWAHTRVDTAAVWAKRHDIDLIVMATHGHGAVQRALVGSMASGLARTTPRPVLLVPPAWRDGIPGSGATDGVGAPSGDSLTATSADRTRAGDDEIGTPPARRVSSSDQ